MSSNSLALLSFALVVAAGPAHAAVSCPASVEGRPLSAVTVFDGPASDNASLVPDSSDVAKGAETAVWDVGYVFAAGRIVHLGCDYGGAQPVILPVPKAASCRYTLRGETKAISCE